MHCVARSMRSGQIHTASAIAGVLSLLLIPRLPLVPCAMESWTYPESTRHCRAMREHSDLLSSYRRSSHVDLLQVHDTQTNATARGLTRQKPS
ncbi:hypothetical protein F5Y08DRAFT_134730 [Xylaria arbuscula]|nr:hypothetical protein F5Y08DRAFT_134730 [Xylaria arbuscula]